MKMKRSIILSFTIAATGCSPLHRFNTEDNTRFIPAEEFSKSIRNRPLSDFSVFNDPRAQLPGEYRVAHNGAAAVAASAGASGAAMLAPVVYHPGINGDTPAEDQMALRPATEQYTYVGDERYISQGLSLRRTAAAPESVAIAPAAPIPQAAAAPQLAADQRPAFAGAMPPPLGAPGYGSQAAALPQMPPLPPPGSSAPYYKGQMTANPSLWPDESEGSYLFRDFRAYQPMDVITILVDDDTKGKKKADTKAEGKFDLLAGITHFFGIETKDWASNNTDLDPSALIQAQTNNKFEGKGETKREGSLTSELSGIVLEVLPNGVLRLEGSKIVAINDEEEVMVVSGLVRARDIDANNAVLSSRIANMRIDFYGRGVLADQQAPGWGARLFDYIWPF